ncbi:hypothetical protein GIB67_005115 [Kingdonia uniflora]|uniref:Uncharacterized protein n=1 Tax=Kingdonia uniflora TaxID=39325 RepID=A0A7J7PCG4_9MAGN|nr:hypothetical protein GIB67_005115 [Kingdonia uniflora]
MQYSIHVPSRSLCLTYNRDLLHSSSNTYTLSEDRLFDLAESLFSYAIFNTSMQYSIHVSSRSLCSTYKRDLLHSSSTIYALSKGPITVAQLDL